MKDIEEKVMTQEEKAKRFDEVLAMAKECITYVPDNAVNQYLLDMFPELKESEDERIRKVLVDFFKSYKEQGTCGAETFNGISTSNILAWLENQGEPVEISPSKFDSQLNKLLKQFETIPKEELISSLSFYLNVVQNNGTYKSDEKQGEQMSAWSEEDENFMHDTLGNLTELKDRYGEGYGKVGKCIDWLKSLKPQLKILKKQVC